MRKVRAVLATLLVSLALVIVIASPASASYSACPSGRACIYVDSGGNGSRYDISVGGGGCSNLPSGWRNIISSAVNKMTGGNGIYITFHDNLGCSNQFGQRSVTLSSNQSANFGFWHNDDV